MGIPATVRVLLSADVEPNRQVHSTRPGEATLCLESLPPSLLSRPGLVLRALHLWWGGQPGDLHPTVDQLARVSGLETRTVQRGLADLEILGLIVIQRERDHPVGRSIRPAEGVTALSGGGNLGAPELSGGDSHPLTELSPHYVESTFEPKYVSRGTPSLSRGDRRDTPAQGMVPTVAGGIGAVADQVMTRLALSVGMEQQQGLRFQGERASVRPPSDSPRLGQVLSRLESADCDETELQWAVSRLAGEYGPEFRPFYRSACSKVRTGTLALGVLLDSVEEASREGVKNRGAAFVAAVQRRGGKAGTPTPGPNRQAHPGVGEATVPDSVQPIKSVG